MRLSTRSLDKVAAGIDRYAYDRVAQEIGIVHLGIGAFHRAHQAWYTDRAMDAGDRNWAITGVSLRSGEVAEQMNPQEGLYTVSELSSSGRHTRLVGAVHNVVPAHQSPRQVEELIAAPTTRIVSLTITEKGYCRAPSGSLDFALAGENSIYPFIAAGLRSRRDAGRAGLTLLSCDNLAANGKQLGRLIAEYLDRRDPSLRAWFETECAFPSTMVDRIVPATTEADLRSVAETIGVEDAAAVMTEPFSQWVIEDRFPSGRPSWEAVGAQVVADVAPYEAAKLRMLNGAHSALAYLGLAHRHVFVHEAIVDPQIRPLVERLMRQEAADSLAPAAGQDLGSYADELLARFANPSLDHRLAQIAMDGSQKISQRWLETLDYHSGRGSSCPAILGALGAWLLHLGGDPALISDPIASEAAKIWRDAGRHGVARAFFGPQGHFAGQWTGREEDLRKITESITSDWNWEPENV